jgi:hypothetical protein
MDFVFKVTVAIIGGVWAYKTFWQQREQNERLAKLQVNAQYSSASSQREVAEAQIVAGLIPLLRCEAPKQQRGFATELLGKMDSRYADAILLSAASCPESTKDAITYSVQEVTRNESRRSMAYHLRVARQLQSLELFRDAVREYGEAYQIGSRLKMEIDDEKARKGIAASESNNYYEAAEWFRLAFQKITTS